MPGPTVVPLSVLVEGINFDSATGVRHPGRWPLPLSPDFCLPQVVTRQLLFTCSTSLQRFRCAGAKQTPFHSQYWQARLRCVMANYLKIPASLPKTSSRADPRQRARLLIRNSMTVWNLACQLHIQLQHSTIVESLRLPSKLEWEIFRVRSPGYDHRCASCKILSLFHQSVQTVR